jgi:hypothetical protein
MMASFNGEKFSQKHWPEDDAAWKNDKPKFPVGALDSFINFFDP